MKMLYTFLFCLLAVSLAAQLPPELRLKKNGKVKRVFGLGDEITIFVQGYPHRGYITGIKDDSVFINREGFHLSEFTHLQRREKKKVPIDTKTLALTTLGVGLSSVGITAAKWEKFPRALAYSATIGFTPYILVFASKAFQGKRVIKLGGKYSLQTFDLQVH